MQKVLHLPNKVFSFFCRSVCSRLTFPPGEAAKVSNSFTYNYVKKQNQIQKMHKKHKNAETGTEI